MLCGSELLHQPIGNHTWRGRNAVSKWVGFGIIDLALGNPGHLECYMRELFIA